MSPVEGWLVLRGVKTLAARMEQHDRSGRIVARFLAEHKKVKNVFYPGLPDHPQYELAKQQMSGFGSMITFETGSLNNAKKMLKKVQVCSLAESLGGVETLISHHATMTHAALGEQGRKTIGITDGMVRISVRPCRSPLATKFQGFAPITKHIGECSCFRRIELTFG